ncbi:MAG: rhodanese-like domain-containing protein [Bacteroidia bacterium]|nr:rhodanese-like domain-containing protein [Bacteroidia bacterium]
MKSLTIAEFEKEMSHALVLDVRNKTVFETGFIPKSLNIGVDGAFHQYLPKLIEKDRRVVLVCEQNIEKQSAELIAKQGFKNIAGWLNNGVESWKQAQRPIDMHISIQADEFATDLYFLNEHESVIDVREYDLRKLGSIESSVGMPLTDLFENYSEMDMQKAYYCHGADGYEAMIGASFLKSKGFNMVKSVDSTYEDILEKLKYHKKV